MLVDLYRLLPPDGAKIMLVLFLSFLTGLEREEHKAGGEQYSFGGVRTFPLIGLIAYAVSFLAEGQILPVVLGFAVVAGFLMLSYRHKVTTYPFAGITSEMAALTTYVAAALVYRDQFWIATTLTVASMLLLELKATLEGLTKRIAPEEILAFTKFLLLTAVILPVVPNQDFGPFEINPAKAWLVVVAVSTVSYGSYVLQKVTKGQGGVLLAALLGGAYSSTVATVVLARRAARENRPHLFAGGTLIASGMMYVRLAGLVTLFNRQSYRCVGAAVRSVGRVGAPRRLALDASARFEHRTPGSRVRAQESARITRRPAFRRTLPRNAGRHALGRHLSGKSGRLFAGRPDGSHRRGPVHHGHDAGRRHHHLTDRSRCRDPDCRSQ